MSRNFVFDVKERTYFVVIGENDTKINSRKFGMEHVSNCFSKFITGFTIEGKLYILSEFGNALVYFCVGVLR